MQKWEYKTIFRDRSNGKLNYEWNIDITKELEKLGADGWELVCISPRCGGHSPFQQGRTDEELWVFKKPIS